MHTHIETTKASVIQELDSERPSTLIFDTVRDMVTSSMLLYFRSQVENPVHRCHHVTSHTAFNGSVVQYGIELVRVTKH